MSERVSAKVEATPVFKASNIDSPVALEQYAQELKQHLDSLSVEQQQDLDTFVKKLIALIIAVRADEKAFTGAALNELQEQYPLQRINTIEIKGKEHNVVQLRERLDHLKSRIAKLRELKGYSFKDLNQADSDFSKMYGKFRAIENRLKDAEVGETIDAEEFQTLRDETAKLIYSFRALDDKAEVGSGEPYKLTPDTMVSDGKETVGEVMPNLTIAVRVHELTKDIPDGISADEQAEVNKKIVAIHALGREGRDYAADDVATALQELKTYIDSLSPSSESVDASENENLVSGDSGRALINGEVVTVKLIGVNNDGTLTVSRVKAVPDAESTERFIVDTDDFQVFDYENRRKLRDAWKGKKEELERLYQSRSYRWVGKWLGKDKQAKAELNDAKAAYNKKLRKSLLARADRQNSLGNEYLASKGEKGAEIKKQLQETSYNALFIKRNVIDDAVWRNELEKQKLSPERQKVVEKVRAIGKFSKKYKWPLRFGILTLVGTGAAAGATLAGAALLPAAAVGAGAAAIKGGRMAAGIGAAAFAGSATFGVFSVSVFKAEDTMGKLDQSVRKDAMKKRLEDYDEAELRAMQEEYQAGLHRVDATKRRRTIGTTVASVGAGLAVGGGYNVIADALEPAIPPSVMSDNPQQPPIPGERNVGDFEMPQMDSVDVNSDTPQLSEAEMAPLEPEAPTLNPHPASVSIPAIAAEEAVPEPQYDPVRPGNYPPQAEAGVDISALAEEALANDAETFTAPSPVETIVLPDVPLLPTEYVIPSGREGYFWNIVESGFAGGVDSLPKFPVFDQINLDAHPERQQALIDAARDHINALPRAERSALGFGATASDLRAGEVVDLNAWNKVLETVAVERGWLSSAATVSETVPQAPEVSEVQGETMFTKSVPESVEIESVTPDTQENPVEQAAIEQPVVERVAATVPATEYFEPSTKLTEISSQLGAEDTERVRVEYFDRIMNNEVPLTEQETLLETIAQRVQLEGKMTAMPVFGDEKMPAQEFMQYTDQWSRFEDSGDFATSYVRGDGAWDDAKNEYFELVQKMYRYGLLTDGLSMQENIEAALKADALRITESGVEVRDSSAILMTKWVPIRSLSN